MSYGEQLLDNTINELRTKATILKSFAQGVRLGSGKPFESVIDDVADGIAQACNDLDEVANNVGAWIEESAK